MEERQPGRFGQSERAHPVVNDAAPEPRGLRDLSAESAADPAARRAGLGD